MDALVQFLRDRLDEDAVRATQWHHLECEIHVHLGGGVRANVAASQMLTEVPGAVCDCGGPARVLRGVEAKRRIVDHVATELDATDTPWWYDDKLTPILTALALPYADHPDYRDDWRP